jgi:hypothetical protein
VKTLRGRNTWQGSLSEVASDRLSLIALLFGSLIALLFYLVAPTALMPVWLTVIIGLILLIIIFLLIDALKREINNDNNTMPRLLTVVDATTNDELPILLLEPSELFGIDNVVSIYHKDSTTEFEILVGYGYVVTVQTDKKIQVRVQQWLSGNSDITDKISSRQIDALKCTIVRPNAPRSVATNTGRQDLAALLAALPYVDEAPIKEA